MDTTNILRRYTSLAALIDILQRQTISFMNPAFWDDRNDAYSLERFRQLEDHGSVLALCLTGAEETYHHWKVFSPGMEGVCIWFDRDHLIEQFEDDSGDLLHGDVTYHTIAELKSIRPSADRIPFLKRVQFADEREYRFLLTEDVAHIDRCEQSLDLSLIKRITLSPWMPVSIADSVKAAIAALPNHAIPVYRSTLVENRDWKSVLRDMK
ncbi:MAG: DUF2971 domain-containing protein [Pseudomonadota bacterium]